MSAYYSKEPREKVCPICGSTFQTETNRETCSKECATKWATQKRWEKWQRKKAGLESPKPKVKKTYPPKKLVLSKERPVTPTTIWLISEYYIKDNYSPARIAHEINRCVEQIEDILENQLLPDPEFRKRLIEADKKREQEKVAKKNAAAAAKKRGRCQGETSKRTVERG